MSGKKAFALRVSDEIFAAVQRWADDELRSVNGQIEYLLRESLRASGRLPPAKHQEGPAPDSEESGESEI